VIVSTTTNLSSFTKRPPKRPFFLARAVLTGICAFGLFFPAVQVQGRGGNCVYCGDPTQSATMCYPGTTTLSNVSPSTQCAYLANGQATCGACDNPNLSNLTLSAGAISPAFNASTTSYALGVQNSTTSTMVTPTASDSGGATVKVNGVSVASGSPSGAITLNVGNNTITTVVTAADGAPGQTYTVAVTRVSSVDSVQLSGTTFTLTIDGYTGHTYQMQSAPSLTGTFNNLGPAQQGSTGNVLAFADPNATGVTNFYRIVLDP
jgi:hypothetical protein